jgi:Class II Aldolase and Adducin N-terminal domain
MTVLAHPSLRQEPHSISAAEWAVRVDLGGRIVGESAYGINYAGFAIHSAIHAARPDAMFIAHILIVPVAVQDAVRRQVERKRKPVEGGRDIHDLIWETSLRKAVRLSPGFDA